MTAFQTRETNPSGASVGLLLGMVALGGFAWWMMREDEAPVVPTGEPEPKEPPPVDFIPVDTNTLTINDDCTQVVVGSTWVEATALPALQQQVQQMGRGLALYPETLLDRAVDVAVRQVLSPYSPCVADMFWRDEWMAANPMPYIEPIYNAATARQKIGLWEQERSIAQTQAAGSHLEFYALVQELRKLTADMYFTNLGVDLAHTPVDTGQAPVLTQSDKTRLMELGYDLDGSVIEAFQNHYNLVKNFQTKQEWGSALLNLIENNTMDSETRDAMVDAQGMQSTYGHWMGLVETAANA